MIIYYTLLNISTDFLEVIALYLKGNHSSSPNAWVPIANSIGDVSRTLVEIFCFDDIECDSIIFHKFWPHASLHNACKYQLLPSTLILCSIGSGSIMSDYDVDVPVYWLTGIHANISVLNYQHFCHDKSCCQYVRERKPREEPKKFVAALS